MLRSGERLRHQIKSRWRENRKFFGAGFASYGGVHGFTGSLYAFFAHLGAAGLVLLGVLDSSFLFLPLGNDLLLVGLTSAHREHLPIYVACAAVGSTLGVLLLDLVARTGGEAKLKEHLSAKRFEYLQRKMNDRAALTLAVAALAPPPFPFTPVVAAASAFAYPRWKLLGVMFGARVVRFTIIGLLAIRFGERILGLAKSPAFEWGMAAFIGVCLVGSGISIYGWWKRSRGRGA